MMIDTIIRQPDLLHQFDQAFANVLISCGQGDEALRYQALLGKRLAPHAFLVSFHQESKMLEKVRLFGETSVLITLPDGQRFLGSLKAHDASLPSLVVEFGAWYESDDMFDQRICPLT
jgi:hypothetical protein